MIPRFDFRYSIHDFINEFINSNKNVKPYLTSVQNYFGGFPLTFTSKARVGICIALKALGLKPGSAIGVQPFTCSSVFFAIKKAGFKIVFIDTDHNFMMSHEDLRIKSQSIDALIITHIFGFPENTDALKPLIPNKPIIEDCAQAFLSEFDGESVGLSGDAGVFSIGYGKLFGIGSGGFIVSKNHQVSINLIRETEKMQYPTRISIIIASFKSLVLGVLYNPTVYNALTFPLKRSKKNNIGLQEYPHNEVLLSLPGVTLFGKRFNDNLRMIRRQQENGRLLLSLIDSRFHAITPFERSTPNYFQVPLQSKYRDDIIAYLARKGIEAGKHFSNSIYWVQAFGYIKGTCPNFERIAGEVFTLPCHHYLSEKKIRFIAETLNNYFEDH